VPTQVRVDFWDVGQADCSVITLPNEELILIDVGTRGSPIVDWLNERRTPPRIRAIVLTHNHADHAGALCSIIAEHKTRIGEIWMLADRDVSDFRENAVFRCAEEAERNRFFPIRHLTAGQVIWHDDPARIYLRAVYPSFTANVLARTPNLTSGLIVLEAQNRPLIAWPGDLDIQVVARQFRRLSPRVLNGPHHGAPSDIKHEKVAAMRATRRVAPRRAFISVGTTNKYSHPRPRYLRTLARRGCHIVCSQLTQRCEMERIAQGRHVFQGAAALGLRPARSGISCRGAWRVTLDNGALIFDRFDAIHLTRIATLKRPQCLLGRGWRPGQDPAV
jgi:beta-lactamase superfamily II metal-dependent hydrolase